MIKINLATRKQSTITATAKTGTIPGLSGLTLSAEDLKDLPLKRILVPLVAGVTASFAVDSMKESDLHGVEKRLQELNVRKTALVAEAGKIKAYELQRKELESDELLIKSKAETVQKLITGRNETAKLVMTLSTLTPKDVWLSTIAIKDGDVSVKGNAIGFQPISELMKNMGENVFFTDVNLKLSEKDKDKEQSGAEIALFEVVAKRRAK